MNVEFPIRTPTSVLFFIIAAVLGYFGVEKPYMVAFAWSAFWWFILLGPLTWLDSAIGRVRVPTPEHEDIPYRPLRQCDLYWVIESLLLLATVVMGILALHSLIQGISEAF